MTGTLRLARPVRLVLAMRSGLDLDGAWWPHTGSVANELPELIEILHQPLGEIVDMRVNWAATEGSLDYNSILNCARSKELRPRRHQRLMVVAGRSARVKLLVVPHMTTPALGAMIMRFAGDSPVSDSVRDDKWTEIADSVIRDAHAECALWTSHMPDMATAE